MLDIEKGKKILSSIFTRIGSSNAGTSHAPAVAGAGVCGESSLINERRKKEKKG
jgi:hypothetical protein